jgi:GTP-binding protein EngB required for normal cell division
MILLLFDAHKLDISDEFQAAIKVLKGQDDKIRVVLNKADKVTSQQLMRVYGAMMWSLGKVVNTPEVMRVYIGSFVSRVGDAFVASVVRNAPPPRIFSRFTAVGGKVHE